MPDHVAYLDQFSAQRVAFNLAQPVAWGVGLQPVMRARENTSARRPVQRRWLVALAGITLVGVVVVAVDPTALCLLPALALATPLMLRRYPGERLIVVLSRSDRQRWARPRSSRSHPQRRGEAVVARGGLLLARSLAVRPPPAAIQASS
jgi:hypothetical protein